MRLHDELKVDVQLHSLPVKLGKPARNAMHSQAQAVRQAFQQAKDDDSAGLARALDSAGTTEEDLKDDAKLLRFMAKLIRSQGDDARATQIDSIAAQAVGQWSAEEMLDSLIAAVPEGVGDHVCFIGVTREDIFPIGGNFLFGLAGKRCAIISYNRFTAAFNSDLPNRARLLQRFHFQCLSSTGRVVGIPACTDPACPRSYPHNLIEQDAKSDKLCDTCREAFEKTFGAK